MRKQNKGLKLAMVLASLVIFGGIWYWFLSGSHINQMKKTEPKVQTTESTSTSTTTSQKDSDLPDVSTSDWNLVLVNREHLTEELSIDLTEVESIPVDSRIAQHLTDFLAAARTVEASETLVSGYRSVAEQAKLYTETLQEVMANDPSLTQEAAEAVVQATVQPAGASEHHTGLAVDMSNAAELNTSSEEVVAQIKALAPQYGFILRYEESKTAITGIGYEDWHWRYVGVESAKYMTEHNLSLEEYIALLQEQEKK
ncbi:M15 family metallopeptidase [Streptococcus caprae]|uniref:M15 family metallopeptidase n=1 Tax=Streptococcus caprae TaxID=1640501 RepID=A0ABV8CV35_9STRE